ncbi:MAG: hypothetical protein KAV82_09760, partial [Phycisphaerae bacterium]|nr:hypothetical protein [Phycisphaerae bacterium]
MKRQTIRKYSISFKRQVITDLESGRFDSMESARVHYGIAGITRQHYYKERIQRKRQVVGERLVLDLVCQERAMQPKLGGRKLLYLISPELASAGVSIGRDWFFNLLSNHDLLIERTTRQCRTTNSWHGFGVYPNLLKNIVLTGPHQSLSYA